jgi:hypothetical protein
MPSIQSLQQSLQESCLVLHRTYYGKEAISSVILIPFADCGCTDLPAWLPRKQASPVTIQKEEEKQCP